MNFIFYRQQHSTVFNDIMKFSCNAEPKVKFNKSSYWRFVKNCSRYNLINSEKSCVFWTHQKPKWEKWYFHGDFALSCFIIQIQCTFNQISWNGKQTISCQFAGFDGNTKKRKAVWVENSVWRLCFRKLVNTEEKQSEGSWTK